jgi:hypothetical protein
VERRGGVLAIGHRQWSRLAVVGRRLLGLGFELWSSPMLSRLRGMAGGGSWPGGGGGLWATRGKATVVPPPGQWRTSDGWGRLRG